MEFITAEQFLEQDKEVQKVFLEWWKPSVGDLYNWRNVIKEDLGEGFIRTIEINKLEMINENDIKGFGDKFVELIPEGEAIPLLTEGQLRKFIEDKFTNATIDINYEEGTNKGYQIRFGIYEFYAEEFELAKEITVVCKNLLQAYWKVALEVAKEIIS